MDTGIGLAIFGGSITLAAAIMKFVPNRNGSGGPVFVPRDLCKQIHEETNRRLGTIEQKLDTLLER